MWYYDIFQPFVALITLDGTQISLWIVCGNFNVDKNWVGITNARDRIECTTGTYITYKVMFCSKLSSTVTTSRLGSLNLPWARNTSSHTFTTCNISYSSLSHHMFCPIAHQDTFAPRNFSFSLAPRGMIYDSKKAHYYIHHSDLSRQEGFLAHMAHFIFSF